MARHLSLLFCFALLGFGFGSGFGSSAALAGERILSFDSDIDIQRDGSMLVSESIRVVAEGRRIRRGIYRDFPTRYKDRFGNNYRVDFEVLEVLRDGVAEPWKREARGNGVRVYAGDADKFIAPGEYSYTFSYRTNRQLGFFDAFDELYWNVTGNGWDFPIEEVTAVVRLPEPVPAQDLSLEAYTGPQGSKAQNYSAQLWQGGGTVSATVPLARRSGMTMVFTWPKGVVQQPDAMQRTGYLLRDNRGLLLALLALGTSLAYLAWAWSRYGRDPEKGVIFPHYEPPPGYSPASARYIRRMGYDAKTLAAAVVNLAVKGHVEIRKNSGDYTLTRQPSSAELAPGEKALLGRLFRSGSTVKLETENHELISIAREAHKDALMRNYYSIYFKRNGLLLLPSLLGSLLIFIVVLVLGEPLPVVAGLVVSVVLLHVLFAWLLKAPSGKGRLLLDKLEGFRLYLEVAEKDDLNLRNPPEKTPQLFERYLPFAIALDVEQAWAEQFADVFAAMAVSESGDYQPNWYRGNFDYNRLGSFSKDVSGGFASAISSAATPPGSSSGSGGGGFSGGGGGGGGGGGW